MLDSYNELITFAFICKTLSITDAAKELNKSKAHVSRQLSNLEKRIGTTLVYRTTRNLTLTENGLALKNDAISLLNTSVQLDYKAKSLSIGICGRFCITIPTSIATSIFSELLLNLNQNFPNVSFEIIVSNKVEPLLNKRIDMAIRIGEVKNDNLVAHKIGSYRDVFISSKSTELPNNIESLTFINNSYHNQLDLKCYLEDETLKINEFKNIISVNEAATQLTFIKNGLGIGLAPSYILKTSENNNKLYNIFPEYHSKARDMYIVYPFQTPLPEKLSKISMYLKKELKKYLEQ